MKLKVHFFFNIDEWTQVLTSVSFTMMFISKHSSKTKTDMLAAQLKLE